jgi:hypothetical protein
MKNMKFIKSALIVGSLVVASTAFADTLSTVNSVGITTGAVSHVSSSILTNVPSKSHLSAFAGVPTNAVSPTELNQVSGDGLREIINKIKAMWKNPSCYVKCR